jgi:hypothetical protein
VRIAKADEKDPPQNFYNFGWMAHLLPECGRDDLFSKLNLEESWYLHDQNRGRSYEIISAFLSARNTKQRWDSYPFDEEHGPGLTHFVGMSGFEENRTTVAGQFPRTDPRAGVFGYDAILPDAQISDGLSNTIMMIEIGQLAGPWIAGGGASIRGARQTKSTYFDSVTGFGPSTESDHALAVFADGSVRSISKNIDPAVFRALCTAHGAETVDLGSTPAVSAPIKE